MSQVKTAELSGPALDWAVAQIEGVGCAPATIKRFYRPSTDWSQGGPLFSKYLIEFVVEHEDVICAVLCDGYGMQVSEFRCGETHLIAACRAIVAAKLGDTVAVPAELLP